jgi:uncharacterized protein YjbI with pentapeptide repeats
VLKGAVLKGAVLKGAVLKGAVLKGAAAEGVRGTLQHPHLSALLSTVQHPSAPQFT